MNGYVNNKELCSRINKRMLVTQDQVSSAVEIICDEIRKDLVTDAPVSVKHFGTLAPYTYPSHRARVLNGEEAEIKDTQAFRTVKFHPHVSFLTLLREFREFFIQNEDDDDFS